MAHKVPCRLSLFRRQLFENADGLILGGFLVAVADIAQFCEGLLQRCTIERLGRHQFADPVLGLENLTAERLNVFGPGTQQALQLGTSFCAEVVYQPAKVRWQGAAFTSLRQVYGAVANGADKKQIGRNGYEQNGEQQISASHNSIRFCE